MFGFTKPLLPPEFVPLPTPVLVVTTIPEPTSLLFLLAGVTLIYPR